MTDAFAPRSHDIDDKFAQTGALIEAARRRFGDDEVIVDLGGLEAGIRELCQAVKGAPKRDVEELGERIAALRDDLQDLGDELSARYRALIGRVEGAKRQPAIKAYGKAAGDSDA
jgi:hypothetical protein